MRTLLIFIALILIVAIGKRLLLSARRTPPRREISGDMVQCARCGMYIPRDEAIAANGRFYCSPAHRDEDPA